MATPSGEIMERPLLTRACGCTQEFQVYKVDRYLAERRAKFQATRCPECVAKYVRQQPHAMTKHEAFGLLPAGTHMTLTRRPDGAWAGSLSADGTAVEAEAVGPQALTAALAQLWVTAKRAD
jgi:hypothetical protein